MKCYRIRKKGTTDEFYGTIYETQKGAKSAMTNRSGYLYRYGNRVGLIYEIVEYDMTEVGTRDELCIP